MKCIVTTFKNVLLINLKTGDISVLHEGAGVYYGITWNERLLMVAARFGYKDELGQAERIATFNKKLEFVGYLPHANTQNSGLHAIQYDPLTNYLWITAPNQNKLIIVDLASGEKFDIYPNESKKGVNWNHFNSVTLNNKHMMVNAHNGLSTIGHGQIYFCDRATFKISNIIDMRGAIHSHNCFVLDGELYTCASNAGLITNSVGKPLRPGKLNGYTRGIAIAKKLLIVGESARATREDRANADGAIHIYNRWNLKHLKTISLPQCGQILAIRILDKPDHHHQLPPFL